LILGQREAKRNPMWLYLQLNMNSNLELGL
jgi:hypothetical protein